MNFDMTTGEPGSIQVMEECFLSAIDHYSEAIELNSNDHLLFSNRSAAYAYIGKFTEALEDAEQCHKLKPDWPMVSERGRHVAAQYSVTVAMALLCAVITIICSN